MFSAEDAVVEPSMMTAKPSVAAVCLMGQHLTFRRRGWRLAARDVQRRWSLVSEREPSKKGVRKLTTEIDGFRFGAIMIRGSVTGLNAILRAWSA
jgi:hypothetical protein